MRIDYPYLKPIWTESVILTDGKEHCDRSVSAFEEDIEWKCTFYLVRSFPLKTDTILNCITTWELAGVVSFQRKHI